MARIRIDGIPPWSGEYELDTDRAFNTREWRVIKKVSGYLPLTVQAGFEGNDPELFVALSVIAMCRAGRIGRADALRVADELAEAPFEPATFTLIGDKVEAEDDALPPALTSELVA